VVKLSSHRWWHRTASRVQVIIFLVLIAMIGAAGVYVHDRQRATLRALGARLADLQREVTGLKADVLQRQQEAAQLGGQQAAAKTNALLAALTQAQPSQQGRYSTLIDDLMQLAKQNGVQVISIRPGEPQDHGSYVEWPIVLEVQAHFRDLGEYLHQVQQLRQVVLVGRIRAELSAVERSALTVQMETVSFVGKA